MKKFESIRVHLTNISLKIRDQDNPIKKSETNVKVHGPITKISNGEFERKKSNYNKREKKRT